MEITTSAFSKIDPKSLSQEALDYFLLVAADKNDDSGIKYFINSGADISNSPFKLAIMNKLIKYRKHDVICQLLIQDTQYKLHNSDVLYALVEQRMVKTVYFLLLRMKEFGIKYKEYLDEAIRIASGHKDYEMIKVFIKFGAMLTPENIEAYVYAYDNGDFNEFAFHFEENIECLIKNPETLRSSAGCGNIKLAEFLIKNGADCTANNNSALQCACAKWDLKMAKLLIENGADCTDKRSYALRLIAYNPNQETPEVLELLQLLVDNGADCTACENEALRMAVKNDHIKMVQFFLKHGADIGAQNHAPIRIAIKDGSFMMMVYLLKKGADLTACNYKAFRMLMPEDKASIMESLLERCKLSTVAINSLLTEAVLNHSPAPKIAELLLKYGADPCIDDNKLLKISISKNNTKMVEILLKYGAKCTEEIFNQAIAMISLNEEIVALLIKYGAFYTNRTIDYAVSHCNYGIIENIYENYFTKLFSEANKED